jgi:hypothetical protein
VAGELRSSNNADVRIEKCFSKAGNIAPERREVKIERNAEFFNPHLPQNRSARNPTF